MLILRIVIIGAVIALMVKLIGNLIATSWSQGAPLGKNLFRRKSEFKCIFCRHCRDTYDDGVLCQYGNKQTFKDPVQIRNCMDFEKK